MNFRFKAPIEKVMKVSLPYLFALLVTLVFLTLFPWFITVLTATNGQTAGDRRVAA